MIKAGLIQNTILIISTESFPKGRFLIGVLLNKTSDTGRKPFDWSSLSFNKFFPHFYPGSTRDIVDRIYLDE